MQRGSSIYYSLLFTPPPQRDIIIALRELHHELTHIIFTCQEKAVALQKVQWWHEELHFLQQQKPRHPLTQKLMHTTLDFDWLFTLVNAVKKDITTIMYDTEQELESYYENTAGIIEKLIAQVSGITDEVQLNQFAQMGIRGQKILHLRDIRQAIIKNHVYLSGDMLMQHNVTLFQLSEKKLTPTILLLFQAITNHCHPDQKLLSSRKTRSVYPGSKKSSSNILFKLRSALLKEITRANFPVMQQRIDLTPIRKWWIARRSCLFFHYRLFNHRLQP